MRASWLFLSLSGAMLCGCGTVADSGGGDIALPNAGIGPFREIEQVEIGNSRVAPYALRDDDKQFRDVSVIDPGGDEATTKVLAFATRTTVDGEDIVQFGALDGRSFDRQETLVVEPTLPWQGTSVSKPSALIVEGRTHVYYAAAEGIGLQIDATPAGTGPVLAAALGWEGGVPPTSPHVSRRGDDAFVMYYEVPLSGGSAIGRATSDDGISWTRVGDAPVIEPGRDGYDAGGAGSPFAIELVSAQDRRVEYVYYGAVDAGGKKTVGLAGRVDGRGAFTRSEAPVFGSANTLGPSDPAILQYPTYMILFATQLAGTTSALAYPAVAVGVAPAKQTLPKPDPP